MATSGTSRVRSNAGGYEMTRKGQNPKVGDTMFFRDGIRRIDYVLAYTANGKNKELMGKRAAKREQFEQQLRGLGIDLEHEPPENSDKKTGFVKLHGTWKFMLAQAEVLKLRLPLRINDVKKSGKFRGLIDRIWKHNPFKLSERLVAKQTNYFTAVFDRRYLDQFIMESEDTFFSVTQRSRMVWDTLLRTEYGKERGMGIKRLIRNGTYEAAYPLHEASDLARHWGLGHAQLAFQTKHEFLQELYGKGKAPVDQFSERQALFESWAHPCRFYKYQPINLIRKYFGEKITIYFAWLGFYTKTLIPAAIFGLICIFYGWLTLNKDIPSNDICDSSGVGRLVMCPNGRITDGEHWNLTKSCFYSQVTYVFDNEFTVAFAVFMSVWATLFLEFWKRRQAELAWEWDTHDADLQEETIRPEYQSRVKTMKMNPITHEREPYMPHSRRLVRLIVSLSVVFFFLFMVLAFVFGIIIYRTIIGTFLQKRIAGPTGLVTTATTAAVLNLIVIMLLDRAYQTLAWHLTSWEFPRTDQAFEDSYTFKVFLFQFINYYSSLFYIAFLKGRFHSVVDSPNEDKYGNYRAEVCDPAGCMVEVLIQLATIMVGKQMFSNFLEIVLPILSNIWRKWRHKGSKATKAATGGCRWEKDYQLNDVPPLSLFFEYLEMVVQYGFITMFVAAFPLAPFFALLNNIIEIRLDAFKFLVTNRRPMPSRAKDLGVWYKILDFISHAAVITNACVIAFTSDFIPRTYYKYYTSRSQSMVGYVQNTLSKFYLEDECANMTKKSPVCSEPFCYYRDYRRPPCNNYTRVEGIECDINGTYPKTTDWWYILVARLLFVITFEHIVFLFKLIIAYVIPDVPGYIVTQMQRESYLAKQALYQRTLVPSGSSDTDQRHEACADGTPLLDQEAQRGPNQEFRYSPVESGNSSDEESPKKSKRPTRRLKL